MAYKSISNNYCKLIENFDVKKSAKIYANFKKELHEYSELTLVNFIVEYYNKSKIQKLLEEYGCDDIFDTVENVYHKILQFKKILDITEKENVVEKLTIEKCNVLLNAITNKSKLKGGKPFRNFIRNIFRRLQTSQSEELLVAFTSIVITSLFVDESIFALGGLLVAIIAGLMINARINYIPDNVFDILYDLIYRNTDLHRRGAQIVSFNQYAQWHIEGIDLIHWLPTFSDQMIRGEFHRDNLRRISSELNLYRALVENDGWIALANDDRVILDADLALRAHNYDIHNRLNFHQPPSQLGLADYLIIRRASNIPDNISNENMCNICYEDLIESNRENDTKNENGYLVRLHQQIDGVAHLFHFKCIKNWFLNGRSRACPLCRVDIDFSRVLVDENIPENEDGIDFFDVPSDEVLGNE